MTVAYHKHVSSLDGLRGIAAIGVVLMHIGETWNLRNYPAHLYLAVPFFFTLSGYVIARSYEPRMASGLSLSRFVSIRLIRLYPMLLISMIIAYLFGAPMLQVFMGLMFVPALTAAALFPANGPQWSLFLELVGNGLHAITFKFLSNRALVIILIVSSVITTYAGLYYGNLEIGATFERLWGGISLFVSSYSIGILIFRGEVNGYIPRLRAPLMLLYILYIAFAAYPQTKFGYHSAIRDLVCSFILFPLIIVFAIRSTAHRWLTKTSKIAGDISYPIYIVHYPIVAAAGTFVAKRSWSDFQIRWMSLFLLSTCVIVSYFLLKTVDEPLRGYLSNRLTKRQLRRV